MSDKTYSTKHVFSPSRLAFYPVMLKGVYEASAAGWPDDAVEVSDEVWKVYAGAAHPPGMKFGADAKGQPTWVKLPPPPPPTLPEQAQALLAGTVLVASMSLPELNGEYPLHMGLQQQINGIVMSVNAGLGLPGGGDTFNWPDADNNARQWPAKQFLEFGQKVMYFVYSCDQVSKGHSLSLPSRSFTLS